MIDDFDDDPTEGAVDLKLLQPRDKYGDWRDGLIRNENGAPRPILANAITALRGASEWEGVLWLNEFTATTTARKAPPWARNGADWQERPWTDFDDLKAAEWLQHHSVQVGVEVAAQAVQAVSGGRTYHPPRDYLGALTWDKTARLNNWLVNYLGVEATPYARAVGPRFLISAVARLFEPGVKADSVLILEGPQGTGKSTSVNILGAPWVTDELADFGSKDAAEQTIGVWIVELAELGSLSRPEVSKIKSFTSRTCDRFRPSYGRRVQTFPRQCVFVGTVNADTYLRDETGGRRFWPVNCRKIYLGDLRRDRDQLWAEAVFAYSRGDPWWLDTPELRVDATKQQDDRYEGDPWEDEIAEYLEKPRKDKDGKVVELSKNTVSISEILKNALRIYVSRWSQQDKNRVARCLRVMNWKRCQVRIKGDRVWIYERPVTSPPQTGDNR